MLNYFKTCFKLAIFATLIFYLAGCAYNTQLRKADNYFQKKEYQRAIELYSVSADNAADENIYTAATLGLIDSYLKINDYKNAFAKIEELEKKVNLDEPFGEWLLFNRIAAEYNLNLFVEAFNDASTFLRMYKQSGKYNSVKEYATLSMSSLGKTVDLSKITGASSDDDFKSVMPDIKSIRLHIADFYKDDFGYVVVKGATEPGAKVTINREKADINDNGEFSGRTIFRFGRPVNVRAEKSATEFTVKEVFDTEEPRKPQGLEGNISGTSIRLRWNDNTEKDLLGYNVYFSDNNSTWEKINRDNDFIRRAEYNFSRSTGVNAYVRITAIDKMRNESEPSDVFQLK